MTRKRLITIGAAVAIALLAGFGLVEPDTLERLLDLLTGLD